MILMKDLGKLIYIGIYENPDTETTVNIKFYSEINVQIIIVIK